MTRPRPAISSARHHKILWGGLAGAGVAVAALVGAVPAQAAVPDHGTFSSIEDYVDDEVCAPEGFSVSVHQVETGDFRVFLDAAGDPVRVIVHTSYVADISAHGITIHESDRWQSYFYPDGSRDVGLTVHIKGPGGIVQQDAGGIGFNDDGSVAYVHGPHPQALGETFCSAFTG
jgi:hypothetical protein